jgi:hypothetical protein
MHRCSRRNALRLVLLAAASTLAPSIASVGSERPPLAIKGYDPVAYFTIGAPVRGLPEVEHDWEEHRYRFSRADHRQLFKADPARYAPQFGNFCAMALAKGEIVVAEPEHWLISGGKLYVFGLPVGPERFKSDLAGNIARAEQNRWLIQKQ